MRIKLTKRQLKRIIREEKQKLQEISDKQQSPGDRAMGLYADMKVMGDAMAAIEEFVGGVVDAAAEDLEVEKKALVVDIVNVFFEFFFPRLVVS